MTLSRLDTHGSPIIRRYLNAAGASLNFFVPNSMKNGSTMLTVTGKADISNATINVAVEGKTTPLKPGDQLILLDASAGALIASPSINSSAFGEGLQGVTMKALFGISADPDTGPLMATVSGTAPNDLAKTISEGFAAGLALVGLGAEAMAGPGLESAKATAGQAESSGGSIGAFVTLTGGMSRFDTGSYIDVNSFSLITGLALGTDTGLGRLTVGAFFEYGKASYDTYNAFSIGAVRGEGDLSQVGGGLAGRLDLAFSGSARPYLEAGFKAGRARNNFRSSDLRDLFGRGAAYGLSSPYFSFHVGAESE